MGSAAGDEDGRGRASRGARRRPPGWDGLAVAGRTDAGVHATGQVASLEANGGPPPDRLAEALNAVLPDDVGVVGAEEAPAGVPRAIQRDGAQLPLRRPQPARAVAAPARRALWWPRRLDDEALHASAAMLAGEHDFTAFTPTETQHEVFVRSVARAAWERARRRAPLHGHGRLVPPSHGADARRDDARDEPGAIRDAPRGPAAPGGGRPHRRGGSTSSASTTTEAGPAAAAGPAPRREAWLRSTHALPVVLFDLDGTLIDSGPIILASMRHAAMTVLGTEPDEELVRAAIGGPGLIAQMRDLDPDRVDELVDAYRAHNEPLHETLESFDGVLDLLPVLRAEGRRLGIVTAKRRATVELAFDRFPSLGTTSRCSSARRTPSATSRIPTPCSRARPARRRAGGRGVRRRLSVRHPRREGGRGVRRRSRLGRDPPVERLAHEEPDAIVHTTEELHAVL